MEEKTTLRITEVISVKLDDWMQLHLRVQELEAEKSNYQSKFWDASRKVEELKLKVSELEGKIESKQSAPEFREINLIDIARRNSKALEEEANE